jgi:hypothetical protein
MIPRNYPISEWQRRLHIVSETAAVLMVPLLFAAAADANEPHKTRLKVLAYGTLAVDGYLLYRWFMQNKRAL